jgi:hypothetical protein
VERSLSPFSATFLHQCIESSVFSSLCDRRLGGILGGFRWPDDPSQLRQFATADGQIRQEKTICTYLDGVAARRGIPLGTPRDKRLWRTFSSEASPEGPIPRNQGGAG